MACQSSQGEHPGSSCWGLAVGPRHLLPGGQKLLRTHFLPKNQAFAGSKITDVHSDGTGWSGQRRLFPFASLVAIQTRVLSGHEGSPACRWPEPQAGSERCKHSLMNSPRAAGWPPSARAPRSRTVKKPVLREAGVLLLKMWRAGGGQKGRASPSLVSGNFLLFFLLPFLSRLFRSEPDLAGSQAVPCSIFDRSYSCCS